MPAQAACQRGTTAAMRLSQLLALCACCTVALPTSHPPGPSETLPSVLTWGGVKVLPSQSLPTVPTPGPPGPFVLSAARNEYEQLQLVVAGPTVVEGVRVSVPDAKLRWSVYRVGYINVTKLTDCYSFVPGGRAPFATPEHLIPDADSIDGQRRSAFPLTVPAGQVGSVIIDFFIPTAQRSGNFSATIEVLGRPGRSGAETIVASQSFVVEVFNATLPSTPTLRTLVGLWPLSGLVKSHGLSDECCGPCYINKYCCCSNNTAVRDLVKKYLRIGLQNRVTFSCLDALTPSPSEVAENPRAWIDFFDEWGEFLSGELNLTSGLQGAALTSVETPCNWGALGNPGGDSRCLASSGMTPQYLRGLITEYDSRGWADRLVFGARDEPVTPADWAQLRAQATFLRSAQANSTAGTTKIGMAVTTDIGAAELHNAVDDIDLFIPVVNRLAVKHGTFNCTHYGGTRCYPTETTDCTGLPTGACLGVDCSCSPPTQIQSCDATIHPASTVRDKYGARTIWQYQSCASWGCYAGWRVQCGAQWPFAERGCDMGWPSMAIDHSGVRNRVMEWSSWLEEVSGELYWDSIFGYRRPGPQPDPSKWGGHNPPDPWTMQTPTGDPKSAGSGDGNLLAPGTPGKIGGTTDIPVESIRLKSMRDGVEDYELLTMAAAKFGREFVGVCLSPFVRSAWDFEDDYQMMQDVRVSIGRSFSKAV